MASWTRSTLGNHEGQHLSAWRDYWHQPPNYDSFVYGGVRFLNLNSECGIVPGGCGAGSPQYTFVQQALAASPQACVVAMWHRPVLSLNEDSAPMRAIWRLLADSGGDLVLNGHIHAMEQYAPLNGSLETGRPDSHMVELISGSGGHKAATGADSDVRAVWQSNPVPGAVYVTAVGGATGQPTALDWEFRDVAGATIVNARGTGAGRVSCGIDQQPPTAPGTPSGTSTTPGTIDLTWQASTDEQATSLVYRVFRDDGATAIGSVTSSSTSTVSFHDSGLAGGSVHTYAVEAFDGANISTRSPSSGPITVMEGSVPIFIDRFDAGLSAWTTVVNVAIDQTQGGASPPSAKIQASGTPGFAWRSLGAAYGSVCVQTGLDLGSISSTVTLLKLRTAADSAVGGLQVTSGRALQVRADVAGSTTATGATLSPGWHTVRLCAAIGTAGSWALTLDGVSVGSWTRNNGTALLSRLQFGDKGTKTVTLNLDDMVVEQT
jgi:hypothetical protein